MSKKRIKNPLNINELFAKGTSHQYFTMEQKISPQLKMLLDADEDYEVRFAVDAEGKERKVTPKPNLRKRLQELGMEISLRGIGFTRASKKQTKQARKQSYASRKRNMQGKHSPRRVT